MCSPKQWGGMGFRDLHLFNKSLLAKQGWRLVQDPNSLLARLLKAKYYPHVSFWEAPIGNNPSFSWRNIVGARQILDEGCFWRVGDGRTIKIWKDRWIPIPHNFKVMTPLRILDEEAIVAELIDVDSQRWNIPLINQVFLPHEAEIIKHIPIFPRGRDKLV